MNRTELNQRRLTVRQLHAKGYSTVDISNEIGCTFGIVYNDLKVMGLSPKTDKPNLILCRNIKKVHDIYISRKGRQGWKQQVCDTLGIGRRTLFSWCEKNEDTLQQWRRELTPPSPPTNWREIIESRKRKA